MRYPFRSNALDPKSPHRLTGIPWLGRLAAATCLVFALTGCSSSTTPLPVNQADSSPGVDTNQADTSSAETGNNWCPGQWIEIDGESFCVDANQATETGFKCPPDMSPYGGFGYGWAACGPSGFDQARMEQQVIAQDGLDCGQMKLDVLVVMDNSTSMCEEQLATSAAMKKFAEQLKDYDADIQFAVTSPDAQCEVDATSGIHASQGRFNQVAASKYPAACYFKSQEVCSTDTDCGAPGEWKCAAEQLDVCIENPNGSINTSCRKLCDTDAECVAEFGVGSTCLQPGGASDSGCLVQPQTDSCAAVTGPVLNNTNIDQLECVAQLGVYSNKCFKYEQGLKSAWMALDPNGALPVQSQVLLRPDARLAIVFITDEDDCSTATDDSLNENTYNTCAFLGDTDNGGPLMPISDLASKYRSLKADPSMVSIMAIAGDSLAVALTDKEEDRTAYAASKQDPRICHQKSYICDGESGTADWGSRYQALTDEFGTNGLFKNICAPEEQSGAFGDLLDHMTAAHINSCGPK